MDGQGAALVVMGVAGSGKSRIGRALSARTGARFIEGDRFHPPENVAKMRAGVPLDDADRAGWLARLGAETAAVVQAGGRAVLACSALKRVYRETLRAAVPGLGVVFLDLPEEIACARVAARTRHFMPASLVASQFAVLEPPRADEARVLRLDATRPVAARPPLTRSPRPVSIRNAHSVQPATPAQALVGLARARDTRNTCADMFVPSWEMAQISQIRLSFEAAVCEQRSLFRGDWA